MSEQPADESRRTEAAASDSLDAPSAPSDPEAPASATTPTAPEAPASATTPTAPEAPAPATTHTAPEAPTAAQRAEQPSEQPAEQPSGPEYALRVGSAGLHAAVSHFTDLPVPAVDLDRETARSALLALPWVGLIGGVGGALVGGAVLMLGAGQVLAAVAGLGVFALAGGARQLRGLAGTADGLARPTAPSDPAAPASQPDAAAPEPPAPQPYVLGTLGIVAVAFVLLLDAAALASPRLAGAALVAALLTAPVVGRVGAPIGTGRWTIPARHPGAAAHFAGVTTDVGLIFDGLGVLAFVALVGGLAQGASGVALFMLGALIAWALAAVWQHYLHRRFGGLTGDALGSVVEVTQTVFLLVLALFL